MKVGTALATKVFGVSTVAPQKDNESAFGGVLSTIADEAGATPLDTPVSKLKTPDAKAKDGKMPDLPAWMAKAPIADGADEAPASMPPSLTAKVANRSAISSADPDATADTSKDGETDTAGDQDATPAAPAPPGASLLALVQIAAFVPNAPQPAAKAADPDTRPAAARPVDGSAPGLSGPSDPSALLLKTAPDPLVTGVSLQAHPAPVTRTSMDAGAADAVPAAQAFAAVVAYPLQIASATTGAFVPSMPRMIAPQTPAKAPVSTTPVPESADAVDAAGPIVVSPTAPTDAQAGPQADPGADPRAGQTEGHGGLAAGPSRLPDLQDRSAPDTTLATSVETGASLVIQQKAPLSAPSLAVADAVTSLASQAAVHTTTASVAPARTMLLQLNPGDLGTVSVRLHLTGHTLDVSLTASNAGTASLLDHDRAALTSALGDRDYQLNSLVIQGGDAASTPGGSSASTDSSGNSPASQSPTDQQGGGSGRGARDPAPRQNGPDRGPAPSAPAGARGDAVFV